MNRIFWIILAVFAALIGVGWIGHHMKTRAINSGEVHVHAVSGDQSSNNQSASSDALAVPAADSITRNPPNGMIFAGTGKYQLYRQGDITWRLDTDSGEACILFATDSEWSKQKVYSHGCGAA
jgi:cytoskeletal protein RodZ